MSNRYPLVNNGGVVSEIPAADAAKVPYLYAVSGAGIGLDPASLGTVSKLTVNANATVDNAAAVQINTGANANKGLVIQRFSGSQSANLLEFQASTGSVLSYVGKDGNLVLPASTTSIASLNLPHGAAPASPVNGDLWTTSSGLYVQINGSTVALGATDLSGAVILAPASSTRNVIQPTTATYIPLTIKGASAQTANLLDVKSSGDVVMLSILPDGGILQNGNNGGLAGSSGSRVVFSPGYYSGGGENPFTALTTEANMVLHNYAGSNTLAGSLVMANFFASWSNIRASAIGHLSNAASVHMMAFGLSTGDNPTSLANLAMGLTQRANTDALRNTRILAMTSGNGFGWFSSSNVSATPDTMLFRGGAGIIEQVNGTNAQRLNIYNTYTDASNYERAHICWQTTANTFTIGTEAAGTGTQRAMQILAAGVTIPAQAAAQIPLTVKGASAQSANLQEWQNSSGTVLANIDANGYITSARVSAGSNFGTSSAPLQTGLYDSDSASNAMEMFNTANSSAVNTGIAFRPGQGMHYIAAIRAFTNSINGAADNTLRFYSAFDATGAIDRTRLTEMMKIGYNYGTILTNNSAAVVALTVKGASAQSANLQEWQNSSGTVVGSISADGQTVAFGNASSGTTTITTKATNPGNSLTVQPATPAGGAPGSLTLRSGASAGADFGPGSINIIVPDKTTNGTWTNGEIYLKGADNTTAGSDAAVAGGQIRLLAGYGVIGTSNNAGAGGPISVTTGAGGTCTSASFIGGAGGTLTLAGGVGGVHSAATGGTGGAGGSLALTAGVGGAQTGSSGTRTGGAGGSITLTAGTGGTGATAAGANGSITLVHGGGTTYRLNVADTGVYVGANNLDTVFGYAALVATSGTTRNTAIGNGAKARQTQGYSMALGDNASTGTGAAYGGIAIGATATATTTGAISLGYGADATGAQAIAIGLESSVSHSAGIALGYNATTTAANQFVVGGDSASITNTYLGNGVTNVAPAATAINATGGSGTDIAGAALTIAGGRGTGTGAGGSILFKTATAGTTGSSLNALVTRGGIDDTGLTYLRGISGQTANLQEWQDNSSTVLASISAAGVLSTPRVIMTPVTAAGATPVDSDVSAWANNTFGFVIGTGGRVFSAWKNVADVYYVEMTAI